MALFLCDKGVENVKEQGILYVFSRYFSLPTKFKFCMVVTQAD